MQLGRVEDVLPTLPENGFDACLCDPPYGLSFMGKAWDYKVPHRTVWANVLRVLKPGAPLVAFSGTRTYHRMAVEVEEGGFEIRDMLSWMHGQGFPKSANGPWGGTALKPAFEPAVLARKPLEGTVAANVAKWGTGGLAIDACRVGTSKDVPASPRREVQGAAYGDLSNASGDTSGFDPNTGRWPANVILDEAAGAVLDEQTEGTRASKTSGSHVRHNSGVNSVARGKHVAHVGVGHEDASGGASRFFYCAKASKKDRGGLGNNHPTVKPTALTEYLARLLLPASGGTLLVPYAGSGSEMIGGLRAGWPNIFGIEWWAPYAAIARRRLETEK